MRTRLMGTLAALVAWGVLVATLQAVEPFDASWTSLQRYQCPQWFKDAKLGIYVHWGVYSVAEYGEWYARQMYIEGSDTYKYHCRKYGHPSKFGYKDLIPLWKAEKFDAEAWLALFKRAGARYFTPCAVHHDGFDLWDSKYNRYNAAKMGPRRDIIGQLRQATLRAGLRWGCTTHLSRSYSWLQPAHWADKTGPMKGVPYDGADPRYYDFYHEPAEDANHRQPVNPPEHWKQEWSNRIKDLIDRYSPDYLYFDGAIPFAGDDGLTGRQVIAHFYNAGLKRHDGRQEVVLTIKKIAQHGVYRDGVATLDLERRKLDDIRSEYWQTDDSIGPWGYRAGATYKSPDQVIDKFIDIVSKNGNLLLNVPPRADGTFDARTVHILEELGRWNRQNGQAIFATRPWRWFGEGDIRFTRSQDGRTLYALFLTWPPEGRAVIRHLASGQPVIDGSIAAVDLLGSDKPVKFRRTAEGLKLQLPEKTNDYAVAVRITVRGRLILESPAQ